MTLTPTAQRALLRAADRNDKTVTTHNGDAAMTLSLHGLADRGALTPEGEKLAAQLRAQEHDLDPLDAQFARLAPGYPPRSAA